MIETEHKCEHCGEKQETRDEDGILVIEGCKECAPAGANPPVCQGTQSIPCAEDEDDDWEDEDEDEYWDADWDEEGCPWCGDEFCDGECEDEDWEDDWDDDEWDDDEWDDDDDE